METVFLPLKKSFKAISSQGRIETYNIKWFHENPTANIWALKIDPKNLDPRYPMQYFET